MSFDMQLMHDPLIYLHSNNLHLISHYYGRHLGFSNLGFSIFEILLNIEIALVIIENGARWLVENFVLSRYNHR